MKLVTASVMAEIDRIAIEERGMPGLLLMEHAGLATVAAMKASYPDLAGRRVLVVAGGGNNGGDGLVVARLLAREGTAVEVVATHRPEEMKGDARTNARALEGMRVPVGPVDPGADLATRLARADIVVDALLGTGARLPLSERLGLITTAIGSSGRPVVAIDVPTGVDADTGEVAPGALGAALTVTFGLPKVGFFSYPARAHVGRLVVAPIGFPRDLLEASRPGPDLVLAREAAAALPPRWPDSHKGDYGRLLVVGGSVGMSGAAVMAARSGLKVGCGLVTLCVPVPVHAPVAAACPEVLVYPLAATESGGFSRVAAGEIAQHLEGVDAVLVGPGIGREPTVREVVRSLAARAGVPVVVDADGIRAVDGADPLGPSVVVTPHAGEAASLLGVELADLGRDRLAILSRITRERGCWAILKGPFSLVSGPGGEVFVVPAGNDGMASAGSGDVLAGIVGGLLARWGAWRAHGRADGRDPTGRRGAPADWGALLAAGVYVHGLAGDLAAARLTPDGVTAPDILDDVPRALAVLAGVGGRLIASDGLAVTG